mmetsp:Transcript_1031/g.2187  ORF Transcript_1031/g.2187 Transcript_1031/m.2187 type:complete len:111 (-) Transcript_1031:51-383(-)
MKKLYSKLVQSCPWVPKYVLKLLFPASPATSNAESLHFGGNRRSVMSWQCKRDCYFQSLLQPRLSPSAVEVRDDRELPESHKMSYETSSNSSKGPKSVLGLISHPLFVTD